MTIEQMPSKPTTMSNTMQHMLNNKKAVCQAYPS
jgi:hypothetical protein